MATKAQKNAESEAATAALKFVAGAVPKIEFDERREHLLIENNLIMSSDGVLSMCSPFPYGISVKPHAKEMAHAVKAVIESGETISLNVLPTGRLSFRCGNFKAFINGLDNAREMDIPLPQGEMVAVTPEMYEAIKRLAPFISKDENKIWSRGIMLTNKSAVVTNMMIAIELHHGSTLPLDVIIPETAVRELIRLGEPPTAMQVSENTATFHYEGGRWLRTTLMDDTYPIDRMRELLSEPCNPQPINPAIFEAIKVLKPFNDEHNELYIFPDRVATHKLPGNGASLDMLTGVTSEFVLFTGPVFGTLSGIMTKIDWTAWPKPCMFRGLGLRGAIVGRVE